MEFVPNNIFDILTIAPHFVPEVLQKPSVRNPIAISLGAIAKLAEGIAGSLCRYYLSLWLPPILGTGFPYATLVVNLSGSFAMGIVTTLVLERALIIAPEVRLLIARQSVVIMRFIRAEVSSVIGTVEGAIGFLGSYTTFSSYELDTIYLFRDFNWQRRIFFIGLVVLSVAFYVFI